MECSNIHGSRPVIRDTADALGFDFLGTSERYDGEDQPDMAQLQGARTLDASVVTSVAKDTKLTKGQKALVNDMNQFLTDLRLGLKPGTISIGFEFWDRILSDESSAESLRILNDIASCLFNNVIKNHRNKHYTREDVLDFLAYNSNEDIQVEVYKEIADYYTQVHLKWSKEDLGFFRDFLNRSLFYNYNRGVLQELIDRGGHLEACQVCCESYSEAEYDTDRETYLGDYKAILNLWLDSTPRSKDEYLRFIDGAQDFIEYECVDLFISESNELYQLHYIPSRRQHSLAEELEGYAPRRGRSNTNAPAFRTEIACFKAQMRVTKAIDAKPQLKRLVEHRKEIGHMPVSRKSSVVLLKRSNTQIASIASHPLTV